MKIRYVVFLTILLPISITFLVLTSNFENSTLENNTTDFSDWLESTEMRGDT